MQGSAKKRITAAGATIFDAIDGPYLDLSDQEGLRRYCEQARNLGFTGKGSINPKQVPIINDIFSPNEDEVKKAFRKMANKYHPDKVSHLGKEMQDLAEEKFKAVNDAYQQIKEHQKLS